MKERDPFIELWHLVTVIGCLLAIGAVAGCSWAKQADVHVTADPPLLGDYELKLNHPLPVLVKEQTQAEALRACDDFEPPRKYDGEDAHWDWCDCMEDQDAGSKTRRFVETCRLQPAPLDLGTYPVHPPTCVDTDTHICIPRDDHRETLSHIEDLKADVSPGEVRRLTNLLAGCRVIETSKGFPDDSAKYHGVGDDNERLVACGEDAYNAIKAQEAQP